jgi:hypothetical protein
MKTARAARCVTAIAMAASMLAAPSVSSGASAAEPSLKLLSPKQRMTVRHGRRAPVFFDPGILVAAQTAPFEIRVRRADYDHPLEAVQVVQRAAAPESRSLPADVLDGWLGLEDFFALDIRRPNGRTVVTRKLTFCPNGFEPQRVNDDGPILRTYPAYCSTNPFTKSMVWGIDEGWAVPGLSYGFRPVKLKDGPYEVTVAIAPRYIELFKIAPEDASATLSLKVKTMKRCRHCGHDRMRAIARSRRDAESSRDAASGRVPTMNNPDPSVLPDLVALPSWGISTDRRRRGDYLTFGATVWAGGASPLVVEGFRRPGEDVMDGWQYFYREGQPIGRTSAGRLESDPRRGHRHWHFKQFAAYRLLNADMTEVVVSTKEAFCLAPTDAIHLDLPGAAWNPETGLWTACGSRASIWVREILPLGWGDTYSQFLPGQSFDITEVPNGTYYIEVRANPQGLLKEQDLSNNTELRKVILKGRPRHRKVVVPLWHGIDTEGPTQGPFPGHIRRR